MAVTAILMILLASVIIYIVSIQTAFKYDYGFKLF